MLFGWYFWSLPYIFGDYWQLLVIWGKLTSWWQGLSCSWAKVLAWQEFPQADSVGSHSCPFEEPDTLHFCVDALVIIHPHCRFHIAHICHKLRAMSIWAPANCLHRCCWGFQSRRASIGRPRVVVAPPGSWKMTMMMIIITMIIIIIIQVISTKTWSAAGGSDMSRWQREGSCSSPENFLNSSKNLFWG